MVTLLLIAVAAVPSNPLPDRFERSQVEALATGVVRELETGYVSPAAAGKAVPALRAKWSASDFLAIPRQLLERMNADLEQALHDKHLRLMPGAMLPPGAFEPESKEAPPEVKKFLSRRHWDIPRVEVLPGNVGVVKLDGFAPDVPESRQAIGEAMAFVKDTEALIVDLRDNHGGEGDTVARPARNARSTCST